MSRSTMVLILVLIAGPALGAGRAEVLDLARPVVERQVPAGQPLEIIISNRLPNRDYRVKVLTRIIEIPPLEWPGGETRLAVAECPTLVDDFLKEITGLSSEAGVPEHIDEFRSRASGCPDTVQPSLELAIATTRQPLSQPVTLNRGQELVVTVEREGREWEFILTTGSRGAWRTFYGFNFFPNGDERYFAAQDPETPGTFVITRQGDREELDFAPSAIFTWLPASQRNRDWGHGVAIGLGFDLDNPIVFGGYGGTYNRNILINAGLVIHKQQRLAGRFSEGQVITENLDEAQLTELTYAPDFYIGIGFRFGAGDSGSSPEAE